MVLFVRCLRAMILSTRVASGPPATLSLEVRLHEFPPPRVLSPPPRPSRQGTSWPRACAGTRSAWSCSDHRLTGVFAKALRLVSSSSTNTSTSH